MNSKPAGLTMISEHKGFTTDSEGMSAELYAFSTELGWVSIPGYFNDDEMVWQDRVTGQTFRRTFAKSAEIVK